jgi:sugar phosphate isomerase/epimerase
VRTRRRSKGLPGAARLRYREPMLASPVQPTVRAPLPGLRTRAFAWVGAALLLVGAPGPSGAGVPSPEGSLWAHDNLVAWCVVPFDAAKRGPEARARMLSGLGFRAFAYDWREKDVPTFDDEIDSLQRHGIQLFAWWYPFDADQPLAKETLEVLRRHRVQPQLWVALAPIGEPRTAEGLPKTPEEQERRLADAARRIEALVRLAQPYGCPVELYNHNGWFGLVENEEAVIERLERTGVHGVGMVYNFSHARDGLHDDSRDFAAVWSRIRTHVVAVNVTGMHWEGQHVYPSQGDSELAMMRVIESSGWRGKVGLIAEKGGDAEVTLRDYITGLDWLAAELRQPGSGGPPPFPVVAPVK